jgi:hypothetical protein
VPHPPLQQAGGQPVHVRQASSLQIFYT